MKTPEEFRKEKEDFPKSTMLCEKLGHYTTDDLMKDYAEYYHQEQVKKLNTDDVSVSFTDSERTEFVETTILLNSQNLSGRETEDELYEAGIVDCFDDLIEKINER